MKVLADLIPGERPLLSVQTSHCALSWQRDPHDLIYTSLPLKSLISKYHHIEGFNLLAFWVAQTRSL